MTRGAQRAAALPEPPILAIVEALARRQAKLDYATASQGSRRMESTAQPEGRGADAEG